MFTLSYDGQTLACSSRVVVWRHESLELRFLELAVWAKLRAFSIIKNISNDGFGLSVAHLVLVLELGSYLVALGQLLGEEKKVMMMYYCTCVVLQRSKQQHYFFFFLHASKQQRSTSASFVSALFCCGTNKTYNMIDTHTHLQFLLFLALLLSLTIQARPVPPNGELLHPPGHSIENDFHSPLPYTYIHPQGLPAEFDWRNVSGVSYVTRSLNQHIPQYCKSVVMHRRRGSCFAPSLVFTCSTSSRRYLYRWFMLGTCHTIFIGGSYQGLSVASQRRQPRDAFPARQ